MTKVDLGCRNVEGRGVQISEQEAAAEVTLLAPRVKKSAGFTVVWIRAMIMAMAGAGGLRKAGVRRGCARGNGRRDEVMMSFCSSGEHSTSWSWRRGRSRSLSSWSA